MASNWPGLGDRILQRVHALGFKNLAQFADAKHYRLTYVYKWAAGTTPDRENLERLAKDLEVHPAWLLFGDEIAPLVRRVKKALASLVGLSLLWASAAPATARSAEVSINQPVSHIMSNRRRRKYHLWWCKENRLQVAKIREFPRLVAVRAIG